MQLAIHIDFETYSAIDVRDVGAYRYAEHPTTDVLICCYAIGDGEVRTWLPWTEPVPADLRNVAYDPHLPFIAHNAEFERQIWNQVLVRRERWDLPIIDLRRWHCSSVRATVHGLPRSLDGALTALGGDVQKDARGKALIRIFCRPRKPTKKDPRFRVLPRDRREEFAEFVAYCRQDVEGERHLTRILPEMTREETKLYHYTCLINDRGLPLDVPTLRGAAETVRHYESQALHRTLELTKCPAYPNGVRPTQREKLLDWLFQQKAPFENLQAKVVEHSLSNGKQMPPSVREVLELRLEASKASTKKIAAMLNVVCDDGRAHGTVLHYGAHTGRLTGKLIQPLNFKRGLLKPHEQEATLDAFGSGDLEYINMLWEKPMDWLSQSMRGFIRAPEGYRFIVVDYSAIEARLLAWLAHEKRTLEAYHGGVDTYKMMASALYNVPIDKVSGEQRRIGKNLRLGAGYQLGPPTFVLHCAKEGIVITEEFAAVAIRTYRAENPNTVRLWYETEDACVRAVSTESSVSFARGRCKVGVHKDWMWIELPSTRRLWYYRPKVELVHKHGRAKMQLTYFGERKKQGASRGSAGRVSTYGGKLVENIIQAISRDILMNGMLVAERAKYPACLSIYDEIVTLRRIGEGSVAELEKLICTLPRWGHGIPLSAEGFECERYRKG